ncbi:MAG: D-alanine--D-alanine ligase [Planctomycetes bacterium]|nr:D-alanine--D-alanine ligase [Planctomycetota bacterium]
MKIAVLAGGISPEREVSLRSGKACFDALKRLNQEAVFIDFQGREQLNELLTFSPDLALLTTHGCGGEDGAIQGMLDWLQIPYTGSGLAASALCMDKYLSKLIYRETKLRTAPFCLYESDLNFQALCDAWSCSALFIKPRWGGSSIGAKKINSAEEFSELKIEKGQALLEAFVAGREITVGYLQQGEGWTVLPALELRSKNEFYDYEAKYTKGMTEFILPAPLEAMQKQEIEDAGLKAIEACGVSAYCRVDFLLNEEGAHIMEINTLPGMTETSDLPAQAKHVGMSFDELVNCLVKSADGGE